MSRVDENDVVAELFEQGLDKRVMGTAEYGRIRTGSDNGFSERSEKRRIQFEYCAI